MSVPFPSCIAQSFFWSQGSPLLSQLWHPWAWHSPPSGIRSPSPVQYSSFPFHGISPRKRWVSSSRFRTALCWCHVSCTAQTPGLFRSSPPALSWVSLQALIFFFQPFIRHSMKCDLINFRKCPEMRWTFQPICIHEEDVRVCTHLGNNCAEGQGQDLFHSNVLQPSQGEISWSDSVSYGNYWKNRRKMAWDKGISCTLNAISIENWDFQFCSIKKERLWEIL